MTKFRDIVEASSDTIYVKTWEVYIVSGGSGWNAGKFYSKADAEKVAAALRSVPHASLGRGSDAKPPKITVEERDTYVFGQDSFDILNKAVKGGLTLVSRR